MSGSDLLVYPQRVPLRGNVTVPGDKSISHRALILAAIAGGNSSVDGWLPAGDTLATLDIVRALGVQVEVVRRSPLGWDLQIDGRGLFGLQPPSAPLDCRNAGTCMRLMAGILAGQSFSSILDGTEQLRKRPMRRIIDPLQELGAILESAGGRAPIHIHPADLIGINYRMEVASAQVKSAILLAALYATGETRVYQPGPARDHTERMLLAMGAHISTEDNWISLSPVASLAPFEMEVPGDISSAAFLAVAAAVVPHSHVVLTNVGNNQTRTGLLDMLAGMGAQFTVDRERITGGEPAVDLTFRFEELHATDVAGATVVRGIDEFPIWTVAATQASGESSVLDAAELRVKEVDRISILSGELRKMGVVIEEYPDGFNVQGAVHLRAAEVDSHGDHRLGMALAVAGLLADEPTLILNAHCIEDSYPGFVETMEVLGGVDGVGLLMVVSGKTQLIGLLGWPLSHSLSPALHNAAAAKLEMDLVYLPLPVHPGEVENAVRGIPALGFLGCNVTVPHKQAVIPLMDEVEHAARAIGAVNTIIVERRKEGVWLTGHNTDAAGFLADLQDKHIAVYGRDCLVLGAGGSARAVTYALASAGARVQVLSRRIEQAQELVEELAPHLSKSSDPRAHGHSASAHPLANLEERCRTIDSPLIVNSTPLGMSPNVDSTVWPEELQLPVGSLVYDLVYNPSETRLMRQAKAAGCMAVNGLGMLLRQGALAFQLWTGKEPDLSIMAAAIEMD